MVDIDRAPDPLYSLAALIAYDAQRANRVASATDATHDIDAATTANYLVDPELVARIARHLAVGMAVDAAEKRGEVEVLIANVRAEAHSMQHDQETT